MSRVATFAAIMVAIAAVVLRGWWWPPLAALLPGTASPAWLGYVEAETTLIAPTTAGRLVARPVHRGDRLAAGAALFGIDPATAASQLAQAQAQAEQAHAQLDDLLTGRRGAEQDVTRAQLVQAEAAAALAEQEFARNERLVATAAVSRAQFDAARATRDQARGRVAELRAGLAVGDLPGRDAAIAAARAGAAAADAAVQQARIRLSDLSPVAPVAALVEGTYYDVGEYVPAGAPVLALLAPANLKLRFFVPEADLARLGLGRQIGFSCDGCAPGQRAVISFTAPRAEYTPPVIYSQTARAKLVFLVEARPLGDASFLHPGLPVEVTPP